MQNTKNLVVAEVAENVAILVYRYTGQFLSAERYGLSSQMRRAAVSVGSNIAEGCGRRSNRELINSLFIAMGSASELLYQCQLAMKLELGDAELARQVKDEIERVKAMLSRLIVRLRQQPPCKPEHQGRGPARG